MKIVIAFALLAFVAADDLSRLSRAYLPPIQDALSAPSQTNPVSSIEIARSTPTFSYTIPGFGSRYNRFLNGPTTTLSGSPANSYFVPSLQGSYSGAPTLTYSSPSLATSYGVPATYAATPGFSYSLGSPSGTAYQTLNYGSQPAYSTAGLQTTYSGIPSLTYGASGIPSGIYSGPTVLSGPSVLSASAVPNGFATPTLVSGTPVLSSPSGLSGSGSNVISTSVLPPSTATTLLSTPTTISGPAGSALNSGIDTKYADNGGYVYKKK